MKKLAALLLCLPSLASATRVIMEQTAAGNTTIFVGTDTQRVGIGNSTPTYTLDVTGIVRTSSNVITQGTMTVQGNAFSVGVSSFAVQSGGISVSTLSVASISGSPMVLVAGSIGTVGGDAGFTIGPARGFMDYAAGAARFGTAAGNGVSGSIQFYMSNSEYVRISSSPIGFVGIGTSFPGTKLHMSSGTLTVDGTAAAINTTGNYQQAGAAGISVTCTSGQGVTQPTVAGGIITAGSCAASGGGDVLKAGTQTYSGANYFSSSVTGGGFESISSNTAGTSFTIPANVYHMKVTAVGGGGGGGGVVSVGNVFAGGGGGGAGGYAVFFATVVPNQVISFTLGGGGAGGLAGNNAGTNGTATTILGASAGGGGGGGGVSGGTSTGVAGAGGTCVLLSTSSINGYCIPGASGAAPMNTADSAGGSMPGPSGASGPFGTGGIGANDAGGGNATGAGAGGAGGAKQGVNQQSGGNGSGGMIIFEY